MKAIRRTRLPGAIDPNAQSASLPLALGDCFLWLDALKITGLSDNDDLTTWYDLSGNNLDFTESTYPPKYRTSAINNKPSVEFGITADTRLDSSSSPTVQNFSLFMVWEEITRSATYPTLLQQDNINSGIVHFISSDDLYYRNSSTSRQVVFNNLPITGGHADGVFCSCFRHEDKIMGWLNDDNYASGYPLTAPSATKSISMGNHEPGGGGSNHFEGYIAEVIFYSRVLTIEEVIRVNTYLNKKWNFL